MHGRITARVHNGVANPNQLPILLGAELAKGTLKGFRAHTTTSMAGNARIFEFDRTAAKQALCSDAAGQRLSDEALDGVIRRVVDGLNGIPMPLIQEPHEQLGDPVPPMTRYHLASAKRSGEISKIIIWPLPGEMIDGFPLERLKLGLSHIGHDACGLSR